MVDTTRMRPSVVFSKGTRFKSKIFSLNICVYFSDPNYNGSLVKAEKTLDMDSSEKEEEQMAGPSSTKHDLPLATFPNAVQGKIILNFLCMLF